MQKIKRFCGKTNMLANQLGYVKYGENRGFDAGQTITPRYDVHNAQSLPDREMVPSNTP